MMSVFAKAENAVLSENEGFMLFGTRKTAFASRSAISARQVIPVHLIEDKKRIV